MVGDGAGHGGRAVHRRQDADVITCRHTAIRAHDSHEHGRIVQRLLGFHIVAESVVAGEVAHGQVVHMHMVTGLDYLGRKPDDLPVTTQRLACLDSVRGDLMAGGDGLANHHALWFEDFTRQQWPAGDQHIVQRIEAQHGGCAGFHNQFHRGLSGYQAWEVAGTRAAPYLCRATIRAPGHRCLMRPLD